MLAAKARQGKLTMSILMILLATSVCIGVVAWRLARCPVLRALGLGMGSWASRCEEEPSEPETTYRPHDPLRPRLVHPVDAARRVA